MDYAFWVVGGIMLYNAGSIPLFMLYTILYKISLSLFCIAYSLNFVLYSCLALMLLRAMRCKVTVAAESSPYISGMNYDPSHS